MITPESNEMNQNKPSGETSPSERVRFLELLNGLTRTILLSKDWNATLHSLAYDIRELIGADDSYILSWDEERQRPIPIMTTAKLDFSFSESTFGQDELDITMSVVREGRVLIIEDARNSPHIDVKIAAQFPSRSGIAVPLIAGGQRLGAVVIGYNTLRQFAPGEVERAEQAGNQIALALWIFQQSQEIGQRLNESNTLAKIEQALSETERIGTGEVLQLIVDSARELMPHAQKSVIHLLDEEEQILVARAVSGFNTLDKEFNSMRMQVGEGVAGQVMREGITVNVKDVEANPHFLLSDSPPTFQSLIVAPVQSGRPIGTISVQSVVKNAFSSRDADLLNALAAQSAIAIENTRLFETTQQRLKEVNILYRISRSLAASLDADQLIRDMIVLLQQSFNYYHVQIYLVDPETRNLVVRHGSGYTGNEFVENGHQVPAGEGIVGHVAQTSEPFMTNNVDEVLFYKRYPLLSQIQSELAVPIKVNEQVMGVLDIEQTAEHNPFTANDLHLVTAIAEHLAVVLQKANLYSTLQTSLQQEKKMRSQLLQSERLAVDGGVHHWWHPLPALGAEKETESGVRTKISDNRLWLCYVTARYLEETADFTALDVTEPFVDDPSPHSLWEHCRRALNLALDNLSSRGLPLICGGDWNDGLNAVGVQGKGESVWLGHFLFGLLTDFADYAERRVEIPLSERYRQSAAALREAINQVAWDGEWYWRASNDQGELLGSHLNTEGRIFLNSQTWAILSNTTSNERAGQVWQSLEKWLLKDYGPLLLYPAYHTPDRAVGYLSRYAPGVRENGGVYTHAATWALLAAYRLGLRENAYDIYRRLCPPVRGLNPELYQAEPYATPDNVDGPDSPYYGRGAWTWYSGSAQWLLRVTLDGLFGLQPTVDGLRLAPCLPFDWKSCRVKRYFRGSLYEIEYSILSGTRLRFTLDGDPVDGDTLPLPTRSVHHVVRLE